MSAFDSRTDSGYVSISLSSWCFFFFFCLVFSFFFSRLRETGCELIAAGFFFSLLTHTHTHTHTHIHIHTLD